MFGKIFDRVAIRFKLALMSVFLIYVTSVFLGVVNFATLKQQLLRGIDGRLFAAAHLAARVPPEGYFDRITDAESVSGEQFEHMVDQNNKLCLQLDLQYLWSCMIVDDRIVFTTSTSPGKDVSKGDHAGFFEVHGDPHAFDAVFATMKPDYSSFHNEWGHGRMVLVPALDSHGRRYCYGASMSINDVDELLRKSRNRTILIITGIFVFGILMSLFISNTISGPVEKLTDVAENISKGNLEQSVDIGGSLELRSLSRSIDLMSESIRRTIGALEDEIKGHQRAEKELAHHRDHLEDMVEERTKALKEAQEKLIVSERLAILGQFAGSVAHEIRNPLGVISASIYYLRRSIRDADEKVRNSLGIIEEHVNRCVVIIESILNLTRMKPPNLEPLDLLEALRMRMDSTAVPGKVAIEWNVPEGPVPVMTDRAQLMLIFNNIVKNAFQAMEEGGTLTVEVETVSAEEEGMAEEVGISEEKGWAEVRFSDTGPGIAPKDMEQIFDPLYTTRTHGVGFGLSIAKMIVERHGGQISVQSEVGEGATFVIRLPLARKESWKNGKG